jgi:hypothetical protein
MRIPDNPLHREQFYLDLIEKCSVSREERQADYSALRSFYLFGAAPEEPPAIFNKIYPHIDQLTSFLYSAESTRFSVDLGATVNPQEQKKVNPLRHLMNDEWLRSNSDQVFTSSLQWALCYNSTFVKLIIGPGGSVNPYMVDPAVTTLPRASFMLDSTTILNATLFLSALTHLSTRRASTCQKALTASSCRRPIPTC